MTLTFWTLPLYFVVAYLTVRGLLASLYDVTCWMEKTDGEADAADTSVDGVAIRAREMLKDEGLDGSLEVVADHTTGKVFVCRKAP